MLRKVLSHALIGFLTVIESAALMCLIAATYHHDDFT